MATKLLSTPHRNHCRSAPSASLRQKIVCVVTVPAAAMKSIAALARGLAAAPSARAAPGQAARLQAEVARLYRLTSDEFAHVLSTFPLVADDARRDAHAIHAGAI